MVKKYWQAQVTLSKEMMDLRQLVFPKSDFSKAVRALILREAKKQGVKYEEKA